MSTVERLTGSPRPVSLCTVLGSGHTSGQELNSHFFSQLSQCPQPLQVLRQRQLSQQGLLAQGQGGGLYGANQSANPISTSSSTANWPSNPIHIKQEIQIPQVRGSMVVWGGDNCVPGLLSDELSGQQSQSGHDVQQHQHPVSSSLQPSATDSHSDPAPTTAATATTATGPHQERPVADHHQLGGQPATQYQQQGTEHRLVCGEKIFTCFCFRTILTISTINRQVDQEV